MGAAETGFEFGEGDEVRTKPLVVVADGHEMVRESITAGIEARCDVTVVAGTADGYSTIKSFRQLEPDLLILDLGLQRPAGTEVLAKIIKMKPDIKVIVVTSEPTIVSAFFALSNGAAAFVPKQSSSSDFVHAVNAVLNGFSYMPNDIMIQFVKSRRNLSGVGNVFGLSPREIEIMKACSDGSSTKQVARYLDISVRTVETHRHNIYSKTSCKNQKELQNIADSL
jgi:DNA-binding NarL/FixJ family response regulator